MMAADCAEMEEAERSAIAGKRARARDGPFYLDASSVVGGPHRSHAVHDEKHRAGTSRLASTPASRSCEVDLIICRVGSGLSRVTLGFESKNVGS